MAIKDFVEKIMFKLVKMNVTNMTNGFRELKWYARIVYQGRAVMGSMEEDIEEATTVNRADIRAVLTAFVEVIWKRLRCGQIVEFPPLGNFRLVILNYGGTSEKAGWTPSLIKRCKLVFQPTGNMRDVTADLHFERVGGDNDEALVRAKIAVTEAERALRKAEHDVEFTKENIKEYKIKTAAPDATSFEKQMLVELESHLQTVEIALSDARVACKQRQLDYKEYIRLHAQFGGHEAEEQDILDFVHLGDEGGEAFAHEADSAASEAELAETAAEFAETAAELAETEK